MRVYVSIEWAVVLAGRPGALRSLVRAGRGFPRPRSVRPALLFPRVAFRWRFRVPTFVDDVTSDVVGRGVETRVLTA